MLHESAPSHFFVLPSVCCKTLRCLTLVGLAFFCVTNRPDVRVGCRVYTGYLQKLREDNHTAEIVTAILNAAITSNWTNCSVDNLFSVLAHKVLPLAFKMNGMEEQPLLGFPDTFQRALSVLKEFIIDPAEVHFCQGVHCNQIWRDKEIRKRARVCPECGLRVSDGAGTSVLRYFPLINVIRAIFAHPVLCQYMACHAKHKPQEGWYRSIWGENAFQYLPYSSYILNTTCLYTFYTPHVRVYSPFTPRAPHGYTLRTSNLPCR